MKKKENYKFEKFELLKHFPHFSHQPRPVKIIENKHLKYNVENKHAKKFKLLYLFEMVLCCITNKFGNGIKIIVYNRL